MLQIKSPSFSLPLIRSFAQIHSSFTHAPYMEDPVYLHIMSNECYAKKEEKLMQSNRQPEADINASVYISLSRCIFTAWRWMDGWIANIIWAWNRNEMFYACRRRLFFMCMLLLQKGNKL